MSWSGPGCIFSKQTRSTDTSSKINCCGMTFWKRNQNISCHLTWQHANNTTVGSSVYTVDSQASCCQMQVEVIAICGISLRLYCRMVPVWIWLLANKVCSSQHNVRSVSKSIFHSALKDQSYVVRPQRRWARTKMATHGRWKFTNQPVDILLLG